MKNAVERVSAAGPKGIAVTRFASWGRGYSADGGKYLQAQEVLHMPSHHQHPSMPLGGDQGGEEEAPIHFREMGLH